MIIIARADAVSMGCKADLFVILSEEFLAKLLAGEHQVLPTTQTDDEDGIDGPSFFSSSNFRFLSQL